MSVQGMELFKERFADFPDRYALIGGSACDLIFASRGLQFRRTKDLDIVILADRPAKDALGVHRRWRIYLRLAQ